MEIPQSRAANKVPVPAIRRLPSYLRLLNEYHLQGREWVS
ncbi:MAG: hypothetical protein LBQ61_04830, partial [Spirochaetales bacterium]|nr:hypothetical protein [Spirochaetales bacterium]